MCTILFLLSHNKIKKQELTTVDNISKKFERTLEAPARFRLLQFTAYGIVPTLQLE